VTLPPANAHEEPPWEHLTYPKGVRVSPEDPRSFVTTGHGHKDGAGRRWVEIAATAYAPNPWRRRPETQLIPEERAGPELARALERARFEAEVAAREAKRLRSRGY
jgi:CO/xanthine dehydrogenase FAD-binding subunit